MSISVYESAFSDSDTGNIRSDSDTDNIHFDSDTMQIFWTDVGFFYVPVVLTMILEQFFYDQSTNDIIYVNFV